MTKKERAIAAIKLKSVDKIPSSYRAINNLTIRLNKYFGLRDPENIIKNRYKLIDKLGTDFYSSGSKIGKFTTFTAEYNGPLPKYPYIEDHQYFYQLGVKSICSYTGKGDLRFANEIYVEPPLLNVENSSEIKDDYLIKRLKYFNFKKFLNKYGHKSLSHEQFINSDKEFICIGNLTYFFMLCWALRGYEKFLADLAFNKRVAEKIIKLVCEFGIEYNRRELEGFGKIAEYYGCVDDLAGQDGMIISPDVFKKYFLPYYKILISNVKKYNIFFAWHCCGSVHKVLPMMIEAGIDVFEVAQTSAKDMNLENLYKLYGKDICIHGGIDSQQLLVFKSLKEIKEEVEKVKNLWGNKGGIIIAPSHDILPDTPIGNVAALYEELNR